MFQRGYPIHHESSLLPLPVRMDASPHYSGRGVTIAFIDSGFYPHPDLGTRVVAHVDATNAPVRENRLRFIRPMWYCWHGQMTSVIACGDGRTSGGLYRGIASDASLVLIKVSTEKRQIKEPDILRGLKWLIANHRRFDVRIVNISVGGDFPSSDPDHPLFRAVRTLVDEGVMVVVAGGNSPLYPLVPPNSAPEAIAIGGYDDDNSRDVNRWRLFTNSFGTAFDGSPKPDVLAPAMWIAAPILPRTSVERAARWLAPMLDLKADDHEGFEALLSRVGSDLPLTADELHDPTNDDVRLKIIDLLREHKIVDAHHQYVSGTSVAAAVASSVVAQIIEANPSLTPSSIKDILIRTAKRFPHAPIEQQGAGVIDAANAVAAAEALHPIRNRTSDEPRVSPMV
ncbi:MAG: S8 family serine peptidase [Anaerolineae bacterium]